MATQAEVIAQLKQIASDLTDTNAAISTLQTEVGKVATETDSLNQKIIDLQNQINQGGTITQELIDAVNEVATQSATVKAGVKSVGDAVQAVDDKVPDAPTT